MYLLTTPEQGDSFAYFFHHSIVIIGALTLKHTNYGGDGWTFGYAYTDCATIILHISWFLQNTIGNYDSLLKLFQKKSIQRQVPNVNQNREMLLNNSKKALNKYEKVVLLSFAMAFLYVRVYKLTKVVPLYVYNTINCDIPEWTTFSRYLMAIGHAGILGVGYLWSSKIIVKLVGAITAGKETDAKETGAKKTSNQDTNQ